LLVSLLQENTMGETKYEVEIPQAVMASFETDIKQNPEGFCGILIGHKVSDKKLRQGDSQDTETETIVFSVAANLVLENRDCILAHISSGQGDSSPVEVLDRKKLVKFCQDKIPLSLAAMKVKILGVVSYSGTIKSSPVQDKKLFKLIASADGPQFTKIFLHMHTSSRKDCQMISTISKVHLCQNKEWKNDVHNQITVPNLGSLASPNYWQPMDIYQSLAVQDKSEDVKSPAVVRLNQLRNMATQRIKDQAEKLFDKL